MTTHATHAHETHAKKEEAADTTAAEPLPVPPEEPLAIGEQVTTVYPGSPPMTVSNLSGNGFDVTCSWFGKGDDFYQHVFHVSEIKRTPKKKGK